MPTIIVQADWPDQLSDRISLIERVVPGESRDGPYLRQLLERIAWALEDAERTEWGLHQGTPPGSIPPPAESARILAAALR